MDQISPVLRRIIAPNPGPMTGAGTNTYILGTGRVAVLDPGPAMDAHLAAIMAALTPGEAVTHLLVSHTHLDHSALAPHLARITGAVTAGFGPFVVQSGIADGGEGIDHAFTPDIRLSDGATLAGDDWQVAALHTPGHAANHLCFASGDVLFSADHIMGWSTSLISPPDGDMAAYMASLARLQTRKWAAAYPGHGDAVTDVAGRIACLIAHRRAREAAILATLGPIPLPLATLTNRVYHDIAPALIPAAMRNVLAHVLDLQSRNLVMMQDATTPNPSISRH